MNDLYRAILVNPDDQDVRMAFLDYLDRDDASPDEHARAEFIRTQMLLDDPSAFEPKFDKLEIFDSVRAEQEWSRLAIERSRMIAYHNDIFRKGYDKWWPAYSGWWRRKWAGVVRVSDVGHGLVPLREITAHNRSVGPSLIFRGGHVAAVVCTIATWAGEKCHTCNGSGQRRRWDGGGMGGIGGKVSRGPGRYTNQFGRCYHCGGTGRAGIATGPQVVSSFPVTSVYLSDLAIHPNRGGGSVIRFRDNSPYDMPVMWNQDRRDAVTDLFCDDSGALRRVASNTAIAWARSVTGLPPIPPRKDTFTDRISDFANNAVYWTNPIMEKA